MAKTQRRRGLEEEKLDSDLGESEDEQSGFPCTPGWAAYTHVALTCRERRSGREGFVLRPVQVRGQTDYKDVNSCNMQRTKRRTWTRCPQGGGISSTPCASSCAILLAHSMLCTGACNMACDMRSVSRAAPVARAEETEPRECTAQGVIQQSRHRKGVPCKACTPHPVSVPSQTFTCARTKQSRAACRRM